MKKVNKNRIQDILGGLSLQCQVALGIATIYNPGIGPAPSILDACGFGVII